LTASDDTLIDVPDTAKTKTWGVGDSEKWWRLTEEISYDLTKVLAIRIRETSAIH
jgi:hypothetical protein